MGFADERGISIFDVMRFFRVELPLGVGVEQQISCPFHEDEHPSARVYADSNAVYCFTCGKKFDPVEAAFLLGRFKTRKDAMRWLLDKFGNRCFQPSAARRDGRAREALIESYEEKMSTFLKASNADFKLVMRIWKAFDDKVENKQVSDEELAGWLKRWYAAAEKAVGVRTQV